MMRGVKRGRTALLVIPLLGGVLLLPGTAQATTSFVVNTTSDHSPGSCTPKDCTLREAVRAANAHGGSDVIVLKGGRTYRLTQTATPNENAALNGDLDITGSVTIEASSRAQATVDGNDIDTVFEIFDPAAVRFVGIVVRDGNGPVGVDAGGIENVGNGKLSLIRSKVTSNDGRYAGGIETGGRLLVKHSVISHNHDTTSTSGIGGIEAFNGSGDGSATIVRSSITGNTGPGDGGLYLAGGGTISRSRITGNRGTTSSSGTGGVDTGLVLHVSRTLIRHNTAGYTGGIYAGGGTELSIDHSTISGNTGTDDVGGVDSGGPKFKVSRSSISANHGYVGGIYLNLTGPGKIDRSQISGNVGTGATGAGGIQSGGQLTITRTTIANNRSAGLGGGIFSDGALMLNSSTISGNRTTADGGGVFQQPNNSAFLTNSTVANNRADGNGGGIAVAGPGSEPISLNAVTIARNVAEANGSGTGAGGGIYNDVSPVTIKNSLIALNSVGSTGVAPDCYTALAFPYTSGGHNLRTTDDVNCPGFTAAGDIVKSTPKIGKLADNGGPTKTIALRKHSPAINRAGSDAPSRDQRGVKRHNPDIGAFERN